MRWSPAENSDQWSLRVPIWSSDPPVKWPEVKSMCPLQQSGGRRWPIVTSGHFGYRFGHLSQPWCGQKWLNLTHCPLQQSGGRRWPVVTAFCIHYLSSWSSFYLATHAIEAISYYMAIYDHLATIITMLLLYYRVPIWPWPLHLSHPWSGRKWLSLSVHYNHNQVVVAGGGQ